MTWDYGRGIVTINSPRTQGLTGFLRKAGRRALADVVIESENEFGAVLVTSLDDRPIKTSKRLLIQSMTEDKHYGWKVENGRIVGLGGYPLNVRDIHATVTIKGRRSPKAVHVLDANGYARGVLKPADTSAGASVRLPTDALYAIVEFGE